MKIKKSSRHQKIIGDFGEHLVCNWLSRSGFEVTLIDHTGIDIIAYNPHTNERLGITVKSRTRVKGQEEGAVNLFFYRKGKNDRKRLLNACKYFACEPWIAVYVETADYADLYLTSLKNYDRKYRGGADRAIDDWKMTGRHKKRYDRDEQVMHIRVDFNCLNWEW